MESKIEFVRERPLGMIPFVLGLALLGGAGAVIGSGGGDAAAIGGTAGVGAALIGVGVALFRRPHRVEVAGDEVRVAGRFGAARSFRLVQVKARPGYWRVFLEGLLLAAAGPGLAFAAGLVPLGGIPPMLLVAAAYADAWRRWRLAPRVLLEDGAGSPAVVRLDGVPGAAEVLAARSATRQAAVVG